MLDSFTKCLDTDCVRRALGDVAHSASAEAERAKGVVEDLSANFGAMVWDDLLPRAQVAGDAVTKAITGDGSVAQRVSKASEGVKSAMNTSKKKCPFKHPWMATFLLAAGAAAAGFVVWSRTRPVEDPWAEESWEDIDDDDLVVVAP